MIQNPFIQYHWTDKSIRYFLHSPWISLQLHEEQKVELEMYVMAKHSTYELMDVTTGTSNSQAPNTYL